MNPEIIFTQDYSYSVMATHATLGQLGDGRLTFGPGKGTTLQFRLSTLKLTERQTLDKVHAVTEDGQHFTLFDCQFEQLFLSCLYLVSTETTDAFTLVEVKVLDISPWFFEYQYMQGKPGTKIEWINTPHEISASLALDDKNLTIKAYPHTSIDQTDDGHLIKDSVCLSMESTAALSISKVRRYTTDLLALLSILLGTPASISSVGVKSDNGSLGYAFFPYYEPEANTGTRKKGSHDYFLKKPIFEANWQTIVQNFFPSKLRDPIWLRLSGMKRYNDFWEYKVLGYVTLWEAYVSSQTQSLGKKVIAMPTMAVKRFHEKLDKNNLTLTNEQIQGVKDLADSAFQTREYTLQEKTEIVISQADPDIVKIINLSSDSFFRLKKIRDEIAHGDIITIPRDEHPLLSTRIEKLTLLLTYFAFIEFGLKKDDFLACLRSTWNRMVRGANLNEAHLDRIMGTAEFITVTNENLLALKPLANGQAFRCFYRNDQGEVAYSQWDTKTYFAKLQSNALGNNPDYNEIFNNYEKKIRYVPNLYFEDDLNNLHFTAVIFFE
ncbi:ApeA N-terminal domain 1-containing protein [Burkholderia glumae]